MTKRSGSGWMMIQKSGDYRHKGTGNNKIRSCFRNTWFIQMFSRLKPIAIKSSSNKLLTFKLLVDVIVIRILMTSLSHLFLSQNSQFWAFLHLAKEMKRIFDGIVMKLAGHLCHKLISIWRVMFKYSITEMKWNEMITSKK